MKLKVTRAFNSIRNEQISKNPDISKTDKFVKIHNILLIQFYPENYKSLPENGSI